MPAESPEFIFPDWSAPENIKAAVTTRRGGVSLPPYNGFNLAGHVGDEHQHVEQNRQLLENSLNLPQSPLWLSQVHGQQVVDANTSSTDVEADASFSLKTDTVCAVMTADCLPVLFCDRQGRAVAAAHAGWRGLAAGILQATASKLQQKLDCPANELMAWMGPAIGSQTFEVGGEVRDAFISQNKQHALAFTDSRQNHWLADIYALASITMQVHGIESIYGGGFCTVTDDARFYSFRRESKTGRMASLIWMSK